ncbi:MAG: F0F1 ATP synthase subunit A [Verrucomicrobia bacterium]|nr:F0F1 ATP synthase subunit A [Verrucomicrobiota bacterium]
MISSSPFLAAIPLNAQKYAHHDHELAAFLSNSVFVALVVLGIIFLFVRRSTSKMALVPSSPGGQNMFEGVVEALYSMLEGIVGKHMIAKTFPLLATIFIFVVTANWFGLLPGVGTIGFGHEAPGAMLSHHHLDTPLLRPANADLNMTLSMALLFMVFWLIWTLQEVGVGGFLEHMFGVKGGVKGALKFMLLPIFIFVGFIELISIGFRPVSLSLRLFGNIFAGENLLHTMMTLGKTVGAPEVVSFILSILVPIPFYFLELLVGVLQALVFTLLCAVYIQLSTSHEEGHGDDHGHEKGDAHAH